MKTLLKIFGFGKKERAAEDEMTLDEYIISIRPKKRELSHIYLTVTYEDLEVAALRRKYGDDNGPEEAGCLVPA